MDWVSSVTAVKSKLWLYRYLIAVASLLSHRLQVSAPPTGRLMRAAPSRALAAVPQRLTLLGLLLRVSPIKVLLSSRPWVVTRHEMPLNRYKSYVSMLVPSLMIY